MADNFLYAFFLTLSSGRFSFAAADLHLYEAHHNRKRNV